MRVLVTGGAGYLGSTLVPMLLRNGHHVTVVDTFTHGVPSLLSLMHQRALTVIQEDARSTATLSRVLEHDAIVLLAAVVGAPACDRDPVTAESLNRIAVEDVVGRARADQLILYPCTNSGYGTGGERECTEDSPLLPISMYGRTKVAAERAVLSHPGGVTMRLATLFGCSPRMRLDLMVNDFVQRAVRDRALVLFEPHFRRNFLHVRDAADAFMFALGLRSRMVRQAYNVGDSRANMSKRQLAEVIQRAVPEMQIVVAESGQDPDRRDYLVSNAKIEALGWRPAHSLEGGVRELVEAFRSLPFEVRNWRNF